MSNTGVSKTRSVSVFLCLTKQCPRFGHRVKQWKRISDSGTGFCLQALTMEGPGILASMRQARVLPGFQDWTGHPLVIFLALCSLNPHPPPPESTSHASDHQEYASRPGGHRKPDLPGVIARRHFQLFYENQVG